mmetsp:Transcript_47446/g.158146  ORF Transcript_47446/g.158146 Transcript_47446/m.158146 type:complete len:120 (+) Transcript_47446:770-1129(+)
MRKDVDQRAREPRETGEYEVVVGKSGGKFKCRGTHVRLWTALTTRRLRRRRSAPSGALTLTRRAFSSFGRDGDLRSGQIGDDGRKALTAALKEGGRAETPPLPDTHPSPPNAHHPLALQ